MSESILRFSCSLFHLDVKWMKTESRFSLFYCGERELWKVSSPDKSVSVCTLRPCLTPVSEEGLLSETGGLYVCYNGAVYHLRYCTQEIISQIWIKYGFHCFVSAKIQMPVFFPSNNSHEKTKLNNVVGSSQKKQVTNSCFIF